MSNRQLDAVGINFGRNHLQSSHFWRNAWMFTGGCQQKQLFLKIWKHWSNMIAIVGSVRQHAFSGHVPRGSTVPGTWEMEQGTQMDVSLRVSLNPPLSWHLSCTHINKFMDSHRAQSMCWALEETQTQQRQSSTLRGAAWVCENLSKNQ